MAATKNENSVRSATDQLGSFVANVSSNEINDMLQHEAKRSSSIFLDAPGAASDEAIVSAIDVYAAVRRSGNDDADRPQEN